MRSIGVVTVGRSDYGLYVPIVRRIIAHPELELRLYVTGAHLDARVGIATIDAIARDGFPIAARVALQQGGDTPYDIARAMGRAFEGFAAVFRDDPPDMLLVLGDRFEMFAAATAAVPFSIPRAHVHGGELTGGAFDEFFRHALTKLSHLHFAATARAACRIIQMGEDPARVIVSGAPALDHLRTISTLSKVALTQAYGIDCSRPVILVTFHPVTLEIAETETYITNLLHALDAFPECTVVCTFPNADTMRGVIVQHLAAFAATRANVTLVETFGAQGYWSMLRHAAVMVGNSSSGIIEAASFGLPVVNVGSRQAGRERGANVIDTGYCTEEIVAGIRRARTDAFRAQAATCVNPYGDGNASERIVHTLASVDCSSLLAKQFHDTAKVQYRG